MLKKATNYRNLTIEEKKYLIFKSMLNKSNNLFDSVLDMYLNGVSYKDIINVVLSNHCVTQTEKEIEERKIIEVVEKNYIRILKCFKMLVDELNLKSSIEICNLFSYLLWNGYFSKNQNLAYDVNQIQNLRYCFALNIMNGSGVCLNFSDMLKDILNYCGYDSCILGSFSPNINRVSTNYMPKIKRNKVDSKLTKLEELKKILTLPIPVANHAFNLISDSDKLYIYDPTNLIYLNVVNKRYAKNGTGKGLYKLDPYFSYSLNVGNFNLLDEFNEAKRFENLFSFGEYVAITNTCMDLFKSNKALFYDYHEYINPDIDKISKFVKKV